VRPRKPRSARVGSLACSFAVTPYFGKPLPLKAALGTRTRPNSRSPPKLHYEFHWRAQETLVVVNGLEQSPALRCGQSPQRESIDDDGLRLTLCPPGAGDLPTYYQRVTEDHSIATGGEYE